MRLGLSLPQLDHFDLARDIVAAARTAEAHGYDSVWVYERLLFPLAPRDGLYRQPGVAWPRRYTSCADPLVTLSLAAAVTERVRLGTSVLVAPLHLPVQLARHLATLDRASGGRVLAGLGLGWSTDEFAAAGAEGVDRAARLDETIDVCRAVWGPDPVSYRGSSAVIAESVMRPKPAAAIPIYLGAVSERGLDRVARRADGWLPAGLPLATMARRWERIRELADGYGRDAGRLGFIVRAGVVLTERAVPEDGRATYTGSAEQVVADLAATAGIGATEVILDLHGGAPDGAEFADRAVSLRELTAGC